jgi:hypothetical protein
MASLERETATRAHVELGLQAVIVHVTGVDGPATPTA